MKITLLGTGTSQGVPVIGCSCLVCRSSDYRDKRLRVSALFEIKDKKIVIDTGPDFRQQMLREKVQKIDAILFTHQHKDHTAGLDDIRPFNHRHRMDMPIYGRRLVLEQLKQEYAYVFENVTYPGIPRVMLHEIDYSPFKIEGIEIIPIEVMHHKLPVLGYRIGDITFITDANYIADSEKEKIHGSKILILNALHKERHISHFNLEQAIEVVKTLKVEKTYLTHISHHMGLHREVSKELPNGIALGYDGLCLEV